jgi:hypothetical protein
MIVVKHTAWTTSEGSEAGQTLRRRILCLLICSFACLREAQRCGKSKELSSTLHLGGT